MHRHRIDKYLDTLLAMKSEATAIFSPQDGRWKIATFIYSMPTTVRNQRKKVSHLAILRRSRRHANDAIK